MPPFQLEVAIALGVCAAASLAAFLVFAPAEGKIQLPVHGNGEGDGPDPFDVAQPEDFVDGAPIDEDDFWKRVRRERYPIDCLLTVL